MLISKTVKMKWNTKNKERLEKLGYIFTKYRGKVEVKVEDLTYHSPSEVKVQCDYCGKVISKKILQVFTTK